MRKWLCKRVLPVILVLALALPYPGAFASAAESGSGGSTSGSGAFGLPEASGLTVGTDEYDDAVANAPYGSTENVVPLFVKSELYMTYGWKGTNRYSHIFDYNQNSTDTDTTDYLMKDDAFESLDNRYRTKFSAGGRGGVLALDTAAVNAGSGRQEYVAVLGIGKTNGSSYLELRDKDDNLVSNTLELGAKTYLTDYAYELGGFAAVTAGDFDGDGVDSIVYYNPPTSGASDGNICESTITGDGKSGLTLSGISDDAKIIRDVYQHFGGSENGTVAKDIPVVHLEAADTDKDGYDELIVTLGRNDVANNAKTLCGTQVLIYDKLDSGWTLTAYYAPTAANGFRMNSYTAALQAKRYVWSTSSVGNVIVSDDSATGTDFPEIVTAGWVDPHGGYDIELDEHTLGVTIVHCVGMTEAHRGQANYQGKYELAYSTTLDANGWTQAGCYDEDDRNSLLQVKCFSYLGNAQAEAIFLSGSVYTYQNTEGNASLNEAYTYNYFKNSDSYIGSTRITNKQIQSVAVGNFDGNMEGREQVVFANLVKKSGGTSHYVSFYAYGYDKNGESNEWNGTEVDGWPVGGKDGAYVSLTDFDWDNDGILVQYEGVERVWEDCDILAILEPQPYFAELGDDFGEGRTAYGKSSSTGSGSENSHGFSVGIVTGYETEVAGFGGGFELSVENGFTWSTNVTRAEEHSITYENQTGENMVVVYRVPVLVYSYKNVSNGNDMYVAKTLAPETASVSVEEYNEQAEAYNMPKIDESKLVTAGDPFSYPSSDNQILNAGGTDVTVSKTGWTVLSDTNTEKTITITQENESSFEYELEVNTSVWGVGFGAKFGVSGGYSYTHSSSKMNGIGTEYSGSVMGPVADGYSFRWNFAMWNMNVGGRKVPVLGYLVTDAAAPASPPTDVEVLYDTLTSTSATLSWSAGSRPAEEYRVYRVMGDGSYAFLASVSGGETECAISGLGENMGYTFVVRAYIDGAESVDSESVTFTTPKKDGTKYVSLGSTWSEYTIRAGESQIFSISVIKNDPDATLAMQWQKRDPNFGKWEDIKGATGSRLTITNAERSQDGTKYRLRVAVVTLLENDPVYYYSDATTLHVGALDTMVTNVSVSVSDTQLNGGTLDDPYIGYANWTEKSTQTREIDVDEPVTLKSGGKTVTVYTGGTGDDAKYIGVCAGTGEAKTYYALTSEGNYGFTMGEELSVQYKTSGGAVVSGVTEAYATSVLTQTDGADTYYGVATLNGSTVTLYWEKDGAYYSESEGIYTLTDATPTHSVCYNDGTTWVLRDIVDDTKTAEGSEGAGSTATAYLTLIQGATVTAGILPDGYLSLSGAEYDPNDFVVYTKPGKKTIQVDTFIPQSGTALNLSATVVADGAIGAGQSGFFLITNVADGTSSRIETTTNDNGALKGAWTAPTAGIYAIRAGVNASASYRASSSDVAYYVALGKDNKGSVQPTTYLAARIGSASGAFAASSVEYGTTLCFEEYTVSNENDTPSSVAVSGGTVTLPTTDSGGNRQTATFTGNAFKPDRAGQYAVALDSSKLTFTVTPLPLTVKTNVPDTATDIDDITLTFDGALEGDETELEQVLAVSGDTGYFNGKSGVFTFSPAWSELEADAADIQRLQSAYSVTLEGTTLRREAGSRVIVYQTAADAHGTLYGFYGDSMTSFASGAQMPEGTKLVFQANSETGYRVCDWTVNGQSISHSDTTYNIKYDDLGESRMLEIDSLDTTETDPLTVEVSFQEQTAWISFSVESGEGGTLSAKTAAGTEISSNTSLAYGSAVTFTATPADGYMVGSWTVNGGEFGYGNGSYCWPGTDKPYQETTLTLSKLGGSTNNSYEVKVSFVAKKTVTVAAPTMVSESWDDEKQQTLYQSMNVGSIAVASSGTAVAAESAVTQGSVLTYTATLDDTSLYTVERWEYSTDGGTTWVKGGSGTSLTLYIAELTFDEVTPTLWVRVIVSPTASKEFNFRWDTDDAAIQEAVNAGTLVIKPSAESNGKPLHVGGDYVTYPVGMPVTFKVTITGENSQLYGVEWSENVTPSRDGLTATMTIPANVDKVKVVATVVKKQLTPAADILMPTMLPTTGEDPTVTVTTPADGFITDGVTENVITIQSSTVTCTVIVVGTDANGNPTYTPVPAISVDSSTDTYRFNTVLTTGEKIITAKKGDMPINGEAPDGEIGNKEILQVKQAANRSDLTEEELAWVDVYGNDGKINNKDILAIKQAANGKELDW